MNHFSQIVLLCLWMICSTVKAQPPSLLKITVDVELGADRGQNYGSLFEVKNQAGQVVAGAGFAGSYNTQPRGDRESLQFYVRPSNMSRNWQIRRMPRVPSSATGFYPFSFAGKLYVHNRSEKGRDPSDPVVYSWNDKLRSWEGEPNVIPYAENIAGKKLAVTGNSIVYDGRTLLKPAQGASFGEHYYANGNLFVKESAHSANPRINRLIVCPWVPETDDQISPREDWVQELPIPFEFIYAFGQIGDQVLAVSNNGRILKFAGGRWDQLRTPPVPAVSYQVYSILNHYDQLLLGQYPTGKIFAYSGRDLTLHEDWPPVLTGVSSAAREAQSLALYGGDLFAGVWPWAELWRLDGHRLKWAFVERMFRHPLASDLVTHPYDDETRRVDTVANLWGQRITGLQPYRSSLIITTSSKTGTPWEERFSFLSEDQRSDYGAIYEAQVPGCFCTAIKWKPGSTRFEFVVESNRIVVIQDGVQMGEASIDKYLSETFEKGLSETRHSFNWGHGVFGPWFGKLAHAQSTPPLDGKD